jgi:hypothetical protein
LFGTVEFRDLFIEKVEIVEIVGNMEKAEGGG